MRVFAVASKIFGPLLFLLPLTNLVTCHLIGDWTLLPEVDRVDRRLVHLDGLTGGNLGLLAVLARLLSGRSGHRRRWLPQSAVVARFRDGGEGAPPAQPKAVQAADGAL